MHAQLVMGELRQGISLAEHTTLKVGGAARYFTRVTNIEELKAAACFAQQNTLPLFILGGGSNVLVPDAGFSGVVIQMGIMGVAVSIQDNEVTLTAGAGVVFDELVADSVQKGYWGLENLSHIPGTVGATPIQNVGAYGVEVSDCVVEVETLHLPTGTERTFSGAECAFGYRSSFFKTTEGKAYAVTRVAFVLSKRPLPRVHYADLQTQFRAELPTDPQVVRDCVITIRANKFPDWQAVPTAGSFFKNPIIERSQADTLKTTYPDLPMYDVGETHVKCSLGYILDKVCGLRGYREGAVRLYEKQALVLVADVGANAQAIDDFAEMIIKKVFTITGIRIEREVSTVSEK